MKKLLATFVCMLFMSCATTVAQNQIVDFESCVAAGNKVLRIYPPKCVAPGVGTFTQKIDKPEVADPLIHKKVCEDLCGNGSCEEMVCMAQGCPCAENPESCPADCSSSTVK